MFAWGPSEAIVPEYNCTTSILLFVYKNMCRNRCPSTKIAAPFCGGALNPGVSQKKSCETGLPTGMEAGISTELEKRMR